MGTWGYFVQYVQQCAHQPEKIAGHFLTGTLAVFGLGRFGSAYLMCFVPPSKVTGFYAVANIALLATGVLHPGWPGVWCVFLASFFMSLMFPTIFALGLKGLGPNTKLGGSLLVMAIVGGAVLTPVMGWISEAFRIVAVAYSVPWPRMPISRCCLLWSGGPIPPLCWRVADIKLRGLSLRD